MKYIFFYLSAFFFLLGCSQEKRNRGFDNLETAVHSSLRNLNIDTTKPVKIKIPANFERSNAFFLSTVLDSITYVRLETKNESLVSNIDQIKLYKGDFYILDVTSKSLLKFNQNGKFIKRIGEKGKGPGEYINPISFCIQKEKDQILVHDDKSRKIVYYSLNGSLIKEVPLKFRMNDFKLLDENTFAINIDRRVNSHLRDIKGYQLIYTNADWQIIGRSLKLNPTLEGRLLFARTGITNFDDKLVYNPNLSYSIYHLKKDKIIEKYTLDLGQMALPKNFDKNLTIEEFLKEYDSPESRYAFIGNPVFETEGHLITCLNYRQRIVYLYYSKASGSLICNSFFNDDMIKDFGIVRPVASSGNTLIGLINAYDVIARRKDWKKYSQESSIPKERIRFAYSVNENDNPIIALYTLKKF